MTNLKEIANAHPNTTSFGRFADFEKLQDFLYEAIFIPEGVEPPAREIIELKKVPTNELLIELQDTEWLLRRRGK